MDRHIETSKTEPTLSTLDKIAEALGVAVSDYI